jgi:hypothetical protein
MPPPSITNRERFARPSCSFQTSYRTPYAAQVSRPQSESSGNGTPRCLANAICENVAVTAIAAILPPIASTRGAISPNWESS